MVHITHILQSLPLRRVVKYRLKTDHEQRTLQISNSLLTSFPLIYTYTQTHNRTFMKY